MNVNSLISEDLALVGVIDPDAYAAGTFLTAAIDMSKYESICAWLILGDRGAAVPVDLALQSSSTSGGSYSTITGKAITQITDESPMSGASNLQRCINLRGSEVTNNNRYVKALLTLTVTSPLANTDVCVVVFGRPYHRPADDNDLSSVDEIVN